MLSSPASLHSLHTCARPTYDVLVAASLSLTHFPLCHFPGPSIFPALLPCGLPQCHLRNGETAQSTEQAKSLKVNPHWDPLIPPGRYDGGNRTTRGSAGQEKIGDRTSSRSAACCTGPCTAAAVSCLRTRCPTRGALRTTATCAELFLVVISPMTSIDFQTYSRLDCSTVPDGRGCDERVQFTGLCAIHLTLSLREQKKGAHTCPQRAS